MFVAGLGIILDEFQDWTKWNFTEPPNMLLEENMVLPDHSKIFRSIAG
jgi:hypothetical protein